MVIAELRKIAAKREVLLLKLAACRIELARLRELRRQHDAARPPERFVNKLRRWHSVGEDLARNIGYRERDVASVEGEIAEFDRQCRNRRTVWMLRELLAQRRRFQRTRHVEQLAFGFAAPRNS